METLGARICIMVSSTRADLDAYREAAAQVIESLRRAFERDLQLLDVSMERQLQTGLPEGPAAVSRRWVEEADWVVLIVGWHYGSLSSESGTEGLGFTEIEYRRARELGKRVFMFLADDPADPALARWKDSDAARARLIERFRHELAERFFLATFADRKEFEDRLANTLHEALQRERDRRLQERFGQLGELIEAVGPGIRDFAATVKLIGACKRVHDCLHGQLQRGVRPIRETVLADWQRSGELGPAMGKELRIALRMIDRGNGALGAELRALLELLPERGGELERSINEVLRDHELWQALVDAPRELGVFRQQIEDFAEELREAFRLANQYITREHRALDDLYATLMAGIEAAQRRRPLGDDERETLRLRLAEIDAMRHRLAAALQCHNRWQEAHDAIELLLAVAGDLAPERRVPVSMLGGLPRLVADELTLERTDPAAYAAFAVAHGLPGSPDLGALARMLDALPQAPRGVAHLQEQLGAFYDAFWIVDKRTKDEVDGAEQRVNAFLEELQRLERARTRVVAGAGVPA